MVGEGGEGGEGWTPYPSGPVTTIDGFRWFFDKVNHVSQNIHYTSPVCCVNYCTVKEVRKEKSRKIFRRTILKLFSPDLLAKFINKKKLICFSCCLGV